MVSVPSLEFLEVWIETVRGIVKPEKPQHLGSLVAAVTFGAEKRLIGRPSHQPHEGGFTLDARINLFENPLVMKVVKHINSAGRVISESTLPATTQELVKLRASQINGCGFCTCGVG